MQTRRMGFTLLLDRLRRGARPGAVSETVQPLRIGHVAWRLEELCRVGIWARESGYCLGPLRPEEIVWGPRGATRATTVSRGARSRALRHLRDGHDAVCRALGVPAGAMQGLLEAWGGELGARFLREAVAECVEDVSRFPVWEAAGALEYLRFHVSRLITPVRPPHSPGEREGRSVRWD